MSEGSEDQLVGFVAGLLLGAAIGATAALLSAPQSGRRTRRRIGRAAVGLRKSTGERFDEVAEDVRTRVDDVLQTARKRLSSE
ncbi:MAG: YtxH domain-containing protein [Gemmatimonadetes bacterium]|nr:YtxH domain-containing protein [Gemmatimonadota bacterium]NNM07076.1 YtxH domain-containing protein [Gemmatimonadota bacterium]